MYHHQQHKYQNSKEEVKSNLTQTGQLAIGQSYNYGYKQLKQFQIDINQYSATGMGRQQGIDNFDIQGMRNQLKLIKSKMGRQSDVPPRFRNENYVDQQTKELNDQLNSLNQKLSEKQQIPVPRTRSIYHDQETIKEIDFSTPNPRSAMKKQVDIIKESNEYTPSVPRKNLIIQQQSEDSGYQPSLLNKQQQKGRGANVGSKNVIDEMPAIAGQQKNKLSIPEEAQEDEEELVECPEGCGRQFRQIALEKHVKVCKKIFQSKREEFNSKEARIINQERSKRKNTSQEISKQLEQNVGPDPKWKKQSEEFRKMISGARNGEVVKYEEVNELTECPGCGRKFNESAAEKHIPFCQNKQKINKFKQRK